MHIKGTAPLAIALVIVSASQIGRPSGAAAQTSQSTWDGVYTEEQAKRGELVYAQTCAVCHGQDLMGIEIAPALLGGQFGSNWNGLSVGELFERVRVSMPANDPGSLNRQQYADVLAYLFSKNDFPVGKTEMSNKTEWLNQIKFQAQKP